jgi:alpha-L-fucosidase 2
VFSNGTKLLRASGDNPNPFYQSMPVKKALIFDASEILPPAIQPTWLYDFPTHAGERYIIVLAG